MFVLRDIKKTVARLVKKHDTRDPFKLAAQLGIVIMYEPLGSIYGYYSKSHQIKVIHVNVNLPFQKQILTVAHELGHAVQHSGVNTAFLKKSTLFSTDKLEIEANTFAVELLLPDELFNIHECAGFTIYDAIEEKGVPIELLSLKTIDGKKFLP